MIIGMKCSLKACFTAAIIGVVAWAAPATAKPRNTADYCAFATAEQESSRRIPPKLLHAISIAESGKWNKKRRENTAWPWTVTSGGKGRYYPSKRSAIRAVRELQRKGVRNIDVGCMQVNLRYHPNAFASLSDAFDPQKNAAYAADFLARLRQEKRSWVQAVKHYHSATPSLHRPYRTKVYKIWGAERRKARKKLIAEQRSLRKRNAQRFKRAQRLLADNRAFERRQNWLDRTTKSLLKNQNR